jgi:selenocysteine lyase/cysteine desulfurase
MNKRDFLRTLGSATAGFVLSPELLEHLAATPINQLAQEEPFWAAIRSKFRLTDKYINLENGYFCFQPEPVLSAFMDHVRSINFQGSHYMRTRRVDDKQRVRTRLAGMAGCSPDELIITRNTTESLDTVIAGFDWKPGDEAVMANQDYGAMLDMFKLQARRYGMVNRLVDIPMDPKSDDEVIQVYARALTPRTKLLMIPHMVNITGHVLPVRAICDMAHQRGVPVMVDGAHTFGHLDFRMPDLHCDYYGSSLHKWLSTPLGAGILYVKRDRIAALWPIYGDEGIPADDITKLNHTGTHPSHTDLGIENAITFHEQIGSARKEARLRHLQRYWTSKVRGVPKIVLNTPGDPSRSCAIANVGIAGIAPADLAKTLLDKYKVFTVAIDSAGVQGVRVTPQVYTSTTELDTFVRALEAIAA